MKTSDWKHASDLSHEEWRERLQAYIRLGDRDVEPVFVGRRELFAEVEDRITRVAKDGKYGSLTTVIGGAPGAGKSAFVAECMRRHRESGKAVPIELESEDMRPVSLVKALAIALGMKLGDETHRSKGVSAFGKIFGVGVGAAGSETTIHPSVLQEAEDEQTVPWETIRKTFGEKLDGRPILLFVDEAQTFRRQQTLHDFIPKRLHKGAPENGVPIIPVYTGLADTGMKLHTEAGLTREVARNAFALGGLSPDESREYARDVIRDYFGMEADADQAAKLYDWMVEEGSGWPQHLRTQLEAVAECLLAANSRKLSALDPERLRQTVEHSRDKYYAQRANRVAKGRYLDVARALVIQTAAQAGCTWQELEETAYQALSGRRHAPSSESYIDDMIHAGLLQEGTDSSLYRCPIPSLYAWIEKGRHSTPSIPGLVLSGETVGGRAGALPPRGH